MKKILNNSGVTLVELIITVAIISILAGIGVPQYGRFVANSRVRCAANDLVINMRYARSLAIKENRDYLVTFNEAGANSYSIGFDGNGNNKLTDTDDDGYGAGQVRTYNLEEICGEGIKFGTSVSNGPHSTNPCPACAAITANVAFGTTAGPVRQEFERQGTVRFTGAAFITDSTRGFTYMVRMSNLVGKIDLLKWDGDNDNTNVDLVEQCDVAPRKYCRWTEIR